MSSKNPASISSEISFELLLFFVSGFISGIPPEIYFSFRNHCFDSLRNSFKDPSKNWRIQECFLGINSRTLPEISHDFFSWNSFRIIARITSENTSSFYLYLLLWISTGIFFSCLGIFFSESLQEVPFDYFLYFCNKEISY